MDLLAELECDDGQGYLYSRAMTKEATSRYIAEIALQASQQ